MQDRFNIRYFNKNTREFEYYKIGTVNTNPFTDCTIYENGQFCTGLKDKNGKLIYEGDILCSPSWWWGPCFVYLDIGECGPCRGDSVMSYILARNINEPLKEAVYNIWNGAEVEVIGNIYEDSHLIENSNNLC